MYKTFVCEEEDDPQDYPLSEGAEYTPLKKGDEYEDDAFDIQPTILFEKEDGKVVCDPYALADSLNLHRRHLTAEQKRELIEKRLKANPEMSDRAIAKEAKANGKTVAAVRKKLEEGAEIPHHETRIGKDGVSQPAEKKPATQQATVVTAAEPQEPISVAPANPQTNWVDSWNQQVTELVKPSQPAEQTQPVEPPPAPQREPSQATDLTPSETRDLNQRQCAAGLAAHLESARTAGATPSEPSESPPVDRVEQIKVRIPGEVARESEMISPTIPI